MCGIFGYVGRQNGATICLNGLKLLEYRGYDSAGITGLENGSFVTVKETGKIQALLDKVEKKSLCLHTAISHTRWATHGKPTEENAHPQLDTNEEVAVVHNGIIENHFALKTMLQAKGVRFSSDTDTEVIAQLVAYHYTGDLLLAVRQTIKLLKGFWAFAVIHKNHPDQIVLASMENPLVIGISQEKQEVFISSDVNAFREEGLDIIFLHDGEIATVSQTAVEVFNIDNVLQNKKRESLTISHDTFSKNGFPHFMIKEIFEQPDTIRQAIHGRCDFENGSAYFENLSLSDEVLQGVRQVLFLGCGTSYHAGLIGASWIEERAQIPARAEIASEFRYRDSVLPDGTLVIAISQSGETFDTLASIREIKKLGFPILAICNAPSSTLAREAKASILLRAGPEVSVCSTKAFSAQLAVLALFSLKLGRLHDLSKEKGCFLLKELEALPVLIDKILRNDETIQAAAKKYSLFNHAFFLGRHYMYITGLEAALKLKETSYINAVGYPAGEMKHGPIALLDKNLPVIGLCGDQKTLDKMVSNLMEVKAREAPLLVFASSKLHELEQIADDLIVLPYTSDETACFIYSVATQLFAYYTSLARGTEIDQPRNLAKSVTVE